MIIKQSKLRKNRGLQRKRRHHRVRTKIEGSAERPRLVVFRVDMVNVPLALGVKELKRGAVGVRAIGYDRTGQATCAKVFTVRNDKATSEAAMDRSDRATVDPAVMQLLRDDLAQQLIWHVELLATGRVQ